MTYYIIYNPTTGAILSVQEAAPNEGESFLTAGEPLTGNLSSYIVKDGKIYQRETSTSTASSSTGFAYYVNYDAQTGEVVSVVTDISDAREPYFGTNTDPGNIVGMVIGDVQNSELKRWSEKRFYGGGSSSTYYLYSFKGNVASYSDLPTNASDGDVYSVGNYGYVVRDNSNWFPAKWYNYDGAYRQKGTVGNASALPASGEIDGDNYWVEAASAYMVWDIVANGWVLGSNYPTYRSTRLGIAALDYDADIDQMIAAIPSNLSPAHRDWFVVSKIQTEESLDGSGTETTSTVYRAFTWAAHTNEWKLYGYAQDSDYSTLSSYDNNTSGEPTGLVGRGAELSENTYTEPDVVDSTTTTTTFSTLREVTLTEAPEEDVGEEITDEEAAELDAQIDLDERDLAVDGEEAAAGDLGTIVRLILKRDDWAFVPTNADEETGEVQQGYYIYQLSSVLFHRSTVLLVQSVNRSVLQQGIRWICNEGQIQFTCEDGLRPYADVVIEATLLTTGDAWQGQGEIEAWPQGEWKRAQYRQSLHMTSNAAIRIEPNDSLLIQTPLNFNFGRLLFLSPEWTGNTMAHISQWYVSSDSADKILYYRIANPTDKVMSISEVILDIIYQGAVTGFVAAETSEEEVTSSESESDEYITDEDIDEVT